MGSSTRNTFPRFKKRLEETIEQEDELNIIEILRKYYFKKNGVSNLQKNIITTLKSNEYINVVNGIIKVSKVVSSGLLSGLGLPGNFNSLNNYEKVDIISDIIGLKSELLSNSLNKTFDEINIDNIINFVKTFTGNILKSIIETFCIEDILEVVGEDAKEKAENEINDFVNETLSNIPFDLEYDENDDAINLTEKLDNMFRNIYLNLKGK